MKKKIIPICLTTLLSVTCLVGCSKQTATDTSEKQDSPDDSSETISDVQQEYLVVDPKKCIGCGKCATLDPEHFLLDATTHKSTVISQSNLDSKNLASAIDRCPVDAITL